MTDSLSGSNPSESAGSVIRHSFWLAENHHLAVWLHLPATLQVRRCSVVICPPIGFELTHSYRSLRRLADLLSSRGFPVLRFDYRGSGDSGGDAFTPGLVRSWLDDVASVAALGRELTGAGETALIGLRLGATLAAHAAAASVARHLVLWAPVTSGRAYVRQWEALQRVAGNTGSDEFLDAGGFVLSKEAARDLKGLELESAKVPPGSRVLHLWRDDLPRSVDPLPDSWPEGSTVEALESTGFADLMATPQDTRIPAESLNHIADWLSEGTGSRSVALTDSTWRSRVTLRTRTDEGPPSFRETLVTVPGPAPLFGVATAPSVSPSATTVVLCNAGSVHHVGPHRSYVELARALAVAGVPSIRFDLRNLGDSLGGPSADENHPYPATALEDVAAVVEWAAGRAGCERVVVAGLCSGAHAAFHAGLEIPHPSLAAVVLINPLTFRWRDGMSLAQPTTSQQANDELYYRRRFTDPAGWKRLIRLQTDFGGLFRFAWRFVGTRAGEWLAEALAMLRIRERKPLAAALLRYPASGRRLSIVFSAEDPGRSLLLAEARLVSRRLRRRGRLDVSVISGADHTFSARHKRDELIRRLVEMITSDAR
jgi:pimeloyl-ACP methyl ester carboxylesterase